MKRLLVLALVLLPLLSLAQSDTLYLKNGDKQAVDIVDQDDDFVYIRTGKKKKPVLKSSLKDYKVSGQKKGYPIVGLPLDENGNIVFSKVVSVEGKSGKEIYQLAKEWTVKSFNNSNYVIRMDDAEAHKLIVKGGIGGRNENLDLNFTLTIEAKDGRFKYTFEDILYYNESTMNPDYAPVENIFTNPANYKSNGDPNTFNKNYSFNLQTVFPTLGESISKYVSRATAKEW